MRYALVTGGSRGIGRATSLELAHRGYHVLINYVHKTDAAKKTLRMVREAGQDGELLMFDVSNYEQTRTAIATWQAAHPDAYIEVLVNNAGIRCDELMELMSVEDWQRVLRVALDGFFNVTQPLLSDMQKHRFGRIINLASLSGLKGMPGQVNYSAAKGGIISATKALAQEVARWGITVNAVAPGFIKTDMTDGLAEVALKKQIPANRFGRPDEVASLIGFLASQEAGYITGDVISINGGL